MRFIRADELIAKVRLSRPTIWRFGKSGRFPKRRLLGRKSVAWVEEEVEEWMASRVVVEGDQESQTEVQKVVGGSST